MPENKQEIWQIIEHVTEKEKKTICKRYIMLVTEYQMANFTYLFCVCFLSTLNEAQALN